jgi:hypothetical protein
MSETSLLNFTGSAVNVHKNNVEILQKFYGDLNNLVNKSFTQCGCFPRQTSYMTFMSEIKKLLDTYESTVIDTIRADPQFLIYIEIVWRNEATYSPFGISLKFLSDKICAEQKLYAAALLANN